MFGARFWGPRYYGKRYWGEAGATIISPTDRIAYPLAENRSVSVASEIRSVTAQDDTT